VRALLPVLLFLCGCHADRRYLGDVRPPDGQRLVFANATEPTTLDPGLVGMTTDGTVQRCLYEGLTVYNPITSLPMAGMATHYRTSADGKEYIFYLRGHPAPEGIRLDDIGTLPLEFSHGVHAPPDSIPARWTDGALVTAEDFVYAWRRLVDPHTASPNGADPAMILNAVDIAAGKRSPDQLGVEALDAFTLRVRLETPAPYFVSFVAQPDLLPVRRNSIPTRNRVIANGPFVLSQWLPYDRLCVRKNPAYYQAQLVRLEEVQFLPLMGTATVNLYRAGSLHVVPESALPPVLLPALRHNQDFRQDRRASSFHLVMNLRDPPFNNKLLRWAVNMALDKRAIADFAMNETATQLMPPLPGYSPPRALSVDVRGKIHDLLAYDPAGAREILAAAGYPGGCDHDGRPLTFLINTVSPEIAEIIRHQLARNLGIQPRVNVAEFSVLFASQFSGTLSGLYLSAADLGYPDPYSLLAPWFTDYAGWRDPVYATQLDEANRTLDPAARMRKLALCETRLLEEMAVIPLTFISSNYLTKPYVRGMRRDLYGDVSFRYAWIDTGQPGKEDRP
jgi:oligopeptide transport system substrate-binding protein